MKPLRVLVVDDSPVCRDVLRQILEAEGDIRVVAEAEGGRAMLSKIAEVAPDLVTMDVRMPGMDGLEAIGHLMAEHPCPILVVTEIPVVAGDALAFEAIRRGALDVARKPELGDAAAEHALRSRVRALAGVPVVRHIGAASSSSVPPLPISSPASGFAVLGPSVIGIGASVGGPAALATLLSGISASCAATFAVVQHLPSGFAASFARFLGSRTALRVVLATRPVPLTPGTVVLPPDDRHLVADGRSLVAGDAPAVAGLRPSVDELFHSLARAHGPRAIGVLLTGIGRDGAAGLGAMRARGAETIAEDESSAVVWGMPRAAIEAGAAMRTLALPAIGRLLVARAGTGAR